ncbi:hypothetical protein [Salipiger thiooxidans]|uniref:hypothetical protein n=1 Tax=Salipiger thiooxidans TaxID=282683 RepID=UPI000B7E8E1B|nr:hypothetical protein [Salipiger thiooxidans]
MQHLRRLRSLLAPAFLLGATPASALDTASDVDLRESTAFLINTNGDLSAEINSVIPTSGRDLCRIGCT